MEDRSQLLWRPLLDAVTDLTFERILIYSIDITSIRQLYHSNVEAKKNKRCLSEVCFGGVDGSLIGLA